MTGRSSWNRRISNLCGTMCMVALPSLTMVSLPGFFSMIAGSSLRDFNGLVQYFSKMSPSTHLRVDRASDSWSTLLQNSDGSAVSPLDRSTGGYGEWTHLSATDRKSLSWRSLGWGSGSTGSGPLRSNDVGRSGSFGGGVAGRFCGGAGVELCWRLAAGCERTWAVFGVATEDRFRFSTIVDQKSSRCGSEGRVDGTENGGFGCAQRVFLECFRLGITAG